MNTERWTEGRDLPGSLVAVTTTIARGERGPTALPISCASSPPVQIREPHRCCLVLARARTRTKGRRSQGHSTGPRTATRVHRRRASRRRHPLPSNASFLAPVRRAPLRRLAGGMRRAEGEKGRERIEKGIPTGSSSGGALLHRRR